MVLCNIRTSEINGFDLMVVCGVAIGNPERHVRKASHCDSKQQ